MFRFLQSINVAVAYPREFIRVVIHQVHIGVTRYIAMQFVNGSVNETTICWSTPNIPGRPCVCNMTQFGQETYYCGRPKDPRLTCDNWANTEMLSIPPQPQDTTKAETELIKKSHGKANATLINNNINILTNSGALPKLTPCYLAPKRNTWGTTMPKGYWSPGLVWNSLLCQDTGKITTNWTLNCLRNTTIWIFGDSNGNRTYGSLLDLTNCRNVVGVWVYKSFCFMPEIGLNISMVHHENPRYGDIPRNQVMPPVNAVLDTVPASGRHMIMIHYYLHYTPSHLGVLYLRMKKLREAIVKLLERNGDVLIGIRGPHITTFDWDYNHAIGGDPLAPRYIDIIRDVFAGLEDRVLYIDGWEMTIAIENDAFHPPMELTREMVKFMLSYFCQ